MNATEKALINLADAHSKALLALGQRTEAIFELQAETIKLLIACFDPAEKIAAARSSLGALDEHREAEMTARLDRIESDLVSARRKVLDRVARMETESDVMRMHLEQIKAAQRAAGGT